MIKSNMKNKTMKRTLNLLLIGLLCFSTAYYASDQKLTKEKLLHVLNETLTPDTLLASNGPSIFLYSQSNTLFSQKYNLHYKPQYTKYGKGDNLYDALYQLLSRLVPNARKAQYITSDMWEAAIDFYCQHRPAYFLTDLSSNQKNQANQGMYVKQLPVDWGKENGGKGGIPTRLALLLVFMDALQSDIAKKRKDTSFFSREALWTSSVMRFLIPNYTDLSKEISSQKILQQQIDSELRFYENTLTPSKQKEFRDKAKNASGSSMISSQEELAKQIHAEINKIKKYQDSQIVGKKKQKKGFLSSWIFKSLFVIVLSCIGFVIYVAVFGEKNSASSTQSEENLDDDEFENE
ncbi:MAG: hypothetical protein AAF770_01965 [Bacteroidota bacterium]